MKSNSQKGLKMIFLSQSARNHVKVLKSKGTESTLCFNKLVILYQNRVLSPRAYQHHFSFAQLIPITRPKEIQLKKKRKKNTKCHLCCK